MHTPMKRLVSALVGLAVMAASVWIGAQVVWDNAISDVLTTSRQQVLAAQVSVPVQTVTQLPSGPPPASAGDPVARMVVPSIGLDWVVVADATVDTLRSGPGWISYTSFPGDPGNAVVSGHRTTYGAPFNRLDELVPGDRIFFEFTDRPPVTYVVSESFEVNPDEVWVTDQTDGAMLTLTTCTPEGSAKFRLVVRAVLESGPNAYVAASTLTS